MRHLLDFTCDRDGCDRALTEAELQLTYSEGETARCAYECRCGAITITLSRR